MDPYIITVIDPTLVSIDLPCASFDDLTRELRDWTNYVEYGVILEVFRFDHDSLDYDLIDRIEA